MKKIFIDGSVGTTGLRIFERLSDRSDLEMITLPEDMRKDPEARKKALNSCDVAFLCLPDAAAIEAVEMIDNPNVTVIDASTAHRTNEGWCYGFPELSEDILNKLSGAKRIAVPGCHASGFISLVYPLIEAGILSEDTKLTCHSITGYSGGGKKMIAEYEAEDKDFLLGAPRQYGIGQQHKHLKEMKKITGLKSEPIFCPIVSDFYSGMTVTVPIFATDLKYGTIDDVKKIYENKYNGSIVKYVEGADDGGFISAHKLSGKDSMQITVAGNEDRILLIAMYDNLGKGASGAAVECLNYVLGASPETGLEL
ncbi:MAG: N-acetyl-gamma-glutamyl-phosphate reductase [Ruminococcaceae bacterium]|nr:N-acetyl-gamma-glutamyl-phosphate reductase [Oscillospiraceae bacterium]